MKEQSLKSVRFPMLAVCAMLGGLQLSPIVSTPAYAQTQNQGTIKGTVYDDLGEPVFGATVMVVGAAGVGTTTDIDGNFSLNVKPGTQLQITFVGFATQTAEAKNGMKVTLSEDNQMLEDVEVVAYGVQKKVTVTGAVASIKSEDLVKTPVSSVNNVLGGALSGVTTVQYSGEPGSDAADIFVRGKGTWLNSSPLIQVDGVERSMSDIDPNEIESITVLKDASATAVFGVRGANGVVLITTKRGQEGKAKISASTSFTALSPTKMVEQANSLDYALFYNQMELNDGRDADRVSFSADIIEKFRSGSDPIRFPSTRWADYIMKDVTLQQQHNINISGGNDKLNYFVSAGFYAQGGLFKEFDMDYDYGYQYRRYNYRANLDLKATKTTTISFNIAGNVNNADKPYTGQGSAGMIKNIYYATPFSSPGIVDGKMVYTTTDYTDGLNLPFLGNTGMAYYGNGFMQTNNNKIQMDLVLDQKLNFWAWSKGLSFKAKGSYNSAYTINKQGNSGIPSFNPLVQYDSNGDVMYNADGTPVIVYRQNGNETDPSYKNTQGKGRDWYIEASLNWARSFGKNNFTALALFNQSKYYYYSSSYPDVPRSYVGFVGRVTYDWATRYMAEFNVGYNGSENFAEDRRYGVFPAGSLGWNISQEEWFKPVKHVINFMKLRASVGMVGNDKCDQRFIYLPDAYTIGSDGLSSNCLTQPLTNTYAYQFGNGAPSVDPSSTNGAYEKSKSNPDVTWEKALKQDYGVDFHFLQERLAVNFDYYKEHRTDILCTDYTVPSMIGFTVPQANLGETKSWGWELSLNWNESLNTDFRYWAKFNLSYNQNEIIEMKEAPQANIYQYMRGHRIGARHQYKFWKYYEGATTESEYKEQFGTDFPNQLVKNLQPGDCVYVDLNKDGKIDESDMSRDYGFTDEPEYIAGLTAGLSWKRLTFNCQFTGAWNVTRYITDVFRQPFYCSSNTTQGGLLQYHVNNTWTPGVYETQSALYPRATWTNANQNYAGSNLWEKDAKYLRLKTISLSYDVHNNWMKSHLGISKCELSLSGYNLITWTPYVWGDPETKASSAPSYPLQRTYTASLNIGF